MIEHTLYEVQCAVCDLGAGSMSMSEKLAEDHALEEGWDCRRGLWYCPDCS